MFTYIITDNRDKVDYIAILNDSGAKIVWEKEKDSVIFRERLDGTFVLNRTGNEALYDRIMSFTYCETGELTVTNHSGEVIMGTFMKKDLLISEDKCRIQIKFNRSDEYTCMDGILDEDYNVVGSADGMPVIAKHNVTYYQLKDLEYVTASGFRAISHAWFHDTFTEIHGWVPFPPTEWVGGNFHFQDYNIPPAGFVADPTLLETYTLYQNNCTLSAPYSSGGNQNFYVTSYYMREIKIIPRVDGLAGTPPEVLEGECNQNEWVLLPSTLPPILYDKYARAIPLVEWHYPQPPTSSDLVYVYNTSSCTSLTYRWANRCMRLNDVITDMVSDCFGGFESIFFKSSLNPISNRNLSNLLISQKSDFIYRYDDTTGRYAIPVDPATQGVLTFKELMNNLTAMFNVYWAIVQENGVYVLRIEHKKYWDNNGSYSVANTVAWDLVQGYPMSLYGTNEYSYEEDIPLREKFSFQEAWNTDFLGKDINYKNCLREGDNKEYSADKFTTDLDITYLESVASNEGFVLLDCGISTQSDDLVPYNYYSVNMVVGKLTGKSLANAHLSWANLHDAYWKYDRYLPSGNMNGVYTEFTPRRMVYQKEISYPYCVQEFLPYQLIGTWMGAGMVKAAEWSFKNSWMTVHLMYVGNEFRPNDPPIPIAQDQLFFLWLGEHDGHVVGEVEASSPVGNPLTFSFISGNEHNTFAIDAVTGVITIANDDEIDIDLHPVYVLLINILDVIASVENQVNITIRITR